MTIFCYCLVRLKPSESMGLNEKVRRHQTIGNLWMVLIKGIVFFSCLHLETIRNFVILDMMENY